MNWAALSLSELLSVVFTIGLVAGIGVTFGFIIAMSVANAIMPTIHGVGSALLLRIMYFVAPEQANQAREKYLRMQAEVDAEAKDEQS